MHIILGATGHVGSAAAQTLLQQNQPVTVVTRDAGKTAEWQQRGAQVAVVDVHDVAALREVLRRGKRLFLLNPPAAPDTDTAAEERNSLQAILAALTDSGLERIVAESTYGAQPGAAIGDLGVLYEMEQALARQPIPASIIRAAYYMSNWDHALQTAREQGQVMTFYPPAFQLPMVAPQDLGQTAARLLLEPPHTTGLHYVEGPARYSSADVAAAFAAALGKPVQAQEIKPDEWKKALRQQGFSEPATESFAAMTELTRQGGFPDADAVEKGKVTLEQYVRELVRQSAAD